MRYEGNTLREALGKALGTRDQYGRKIVRGRPLLRKQVDVTSPHATAQAIGMARIEAVRVARTEIASKTVAAGQDETGIIIAYNRETGELRVLHEPESGRPLRLAGQTEGEASKFQFTTAHLRSNEIALCTAHTHPLTRRPRDIRVQRHYDAIDDANTIRSESDLNTLDARLFRIGPIIIRNPEGDVVDLWGDWRGR